MTAIIVHYVLRSRRNLVPTMACGFDWATAGWLVTNIRDKVTCKDCRRTWPVGWK